MNADTTATYFCSILIGQPDAPLVYHDDIPVLRVVIDVHIELVSALPLNPSFTRLDLRPRLVPMPILSFGESVSTSHQPLCTVAESYLDDSWILREMATIKP